VRGQTSDPSFRHRSTASVLLQARVLAFCRHEYWQKVARIVGKAYEVIEQREGQLPKGIAEEMDDRLAILVASGQLESKGNIKRWTHSEVRLPGSEPAEVELPPH
jgi:hypothetical protein